MPVAAVLMSYEIYNAFIKGSGQFIHGQTYQDMPVLATVGSKVIDIITENNNELIINGATLGLYIMECLKKELGNHPYVGDIRGGGSFIGIEFVANKETKEPFNKKLKISYNLSEFALSEPYNIAVYPSSGTVDGYSGDIIIISPPITITKSEARLIVKRISAAIKDFFSSRNS